MASVARGFGGLAVSMFVVVSLSGCVGAGSGFAVFDREAEPADAIPVGLPDFPAEDVEPSSSRLVGEYDGDSLYLVKSSGGDVCLLVSPREPRQWVMGCGEGPELGVGGPSGEYSVRPDSAPAPDDSTQVSANVYATD